MNEREASTSTYFQTVIFSFKNVLKDFCSRKEEEKLFGVAERRSRAPGQA